MILAGASFEAALAAAERVRVRVESARPMGEDEGRVTCSVGVATFPNRPRRKHAGAIGICVHEDWQGKGVGKELMHAIIDLADNWLNLTRLELEVYSDNEAATHLYERFGFEIEGTLRQHAFREGRYVDSKMMGRLRPGSVP